jgi:23S rRNA (adenine2030-N6)-methyltransferase
MNYRHAYHAGNFADVLKHATLALVIEHLKLKPAPFRVVDTHAGIGEYDLHGEAAGKTGEWRDGIARLLAASRPEAVSAVLAPYLGALEPGLRDGALRYYPGSPLLARRLIRAGDRVMANELHPDDAAMLAARFARDRRVKVSSMDGWTALKAFLPPVERRGVVLIDPPFEEPGEFERMASGLREAMARFATGIFLLWYPIKAIAPVRQFERLVAESCPAPILSVELMIRSGQDTTALNGTGLIVVNPPYTLHDNLATVLPFLSETLHRDGSAAWRLDSAAAAHRATLTSN